MSNFPFLAVDIGNARIKIGLFRRSSGDGLPEPERILPLDGDRPPFELIDPWLAEISPPILAAPSWFIASVNRPSATRLVDWLSRHRPEDRVVLLSAADLPLEVRLQRPDMVGIDRLVDAVAVNRLKNPNSPAAIVDVGSAITVDLVSSSGEFLGGAILPGLAMSARAMHEFTDLLPLIETDDLREPPPALGTETEEAMRSGLFWGAIGAIRQLVEELGRQSSLTNEISDDAHNSIEVFLTGGAGATVASLLGPNARHIPHLTLAGIALSVSERLF
jgi:type III pantothenate kinase